MSIYITFWSIVNILVSWSPCDAGDFWRTLSYGLDTTAELPPERWDMDAFYDSDPDAPGKTYVRQDKWCDCGQWWCSCLTKCHCFLCRLGHFIPGIEQFDGEFFGLSEMEQRGMVTSSSHFQRFMSGNECRRNEWNWGSTPMAHIGNHLWLHVCFRWVTRVTC